MDNATSERWLPISGFENYAVSDHGRVKRLPVLGADGRRLWELLFKLGNRDPAGYPSVRLSADGKVTHLRVHTLVMRAFAGPCPPGMEIRHLDGNPANNRLGNLAYGTSRENAQDTLRHSTHANQRKTRCPAGHEYTPENTGKAQRRDGREFRICRQCRRDRGWPVPRAAS